MITLTAAARCIAPGCDWTSEGDPEAVDKAAERHWRTVRHATAVVSVPRRTT